MGGQEAFGVERGGERPAGQETFWGKVQLRRAVSSSILTAGVGANINVPLPRGDALEEAMKAYTAQAYAGMPATATHLPAAPEPGHPIRATRARGRSFLDLDVERLDDALPGRRVLAHELREGLTAEVHR